MTASAQLLSSLPSARRPDFRGVNLDEVLKALMAEARSAWPWEGEFDEGQFVAHLARHVAKPSDLKKLRAKDLGLTFGCLLGRSWAITTFVSEVLPQAVAAARVVQKDGTVDDVRQQLLMRLLVGTETQEAGLVQYAGMAPLESWVRAAAVRTAQNWTTRQEKPAGRSPHAMLPSDPELEILKRQYHRPFKQAFERAMKSLSAEELLLVRLHAVEHLSIDKLAALLQVHRATAARRVARAREVLAERTIEQLRTMLGVDGSDLKSIVRLVRSNIDLSLLRVAREGTD